MLCFVVCFVLLYGFIASLFSNGIGVVSWTWGKSPSRMIKKPIPNHGGRIISTSMPQLTQSCPDVPVKKLHRRLRRDSNPRPQAYPHWYIYQFLKINNKRFPFCSKLNYPLHVISVICWNCISFFFMAGVGGGGGGQRGYKLSMPSEFLYNPSVSPVQTPESYVQVSSVRFTSQVMKHWSSMTHRTLPVSHRSKVSHRWS